MNGILIINAIKKIYPEIKGGLVYWNTKEDGTVWNHPSEGLVWENKQFPKPDWTDIEAKIIELEELN